jgi:hypothetical protein
MAKPKAKERFSRRGSSHLRTRAFKSVGRCPITRKGRILRASDCRSGFQAGVRFDHDMACDQSIRPEERTRGNMMVFCAAIAVLLAIALY